MRVNEAPQMPETVYHYCTPQNCRNILQSKELWLSNVHCMCDSTEQRWFLERAERRLRELAVGGRTRDIDPIMANRTWMALDPYVFCFSETPDIPNQWQNYAAGATGFVIGFSTAWIQNQTHRYSRHHPMLWPVEYDEQKQNNLLEHYLNKYFESIDNGGDRQDAGMRLILAIYGLSAASKKASFAQEREIRAIVMEPRDPDAFHPEYHTGISERRNRTYDGRQISYFSLSFSEDAVASIYLGANNSDGIASVHKILAQNGYDQDRIKIEVPDFHAVRS